MLPTPVVNLPQHPKFIRVAEMNLLQSQPNNSPHRVLILDYPSQANKFYPVETSENLERLSKYKELANSYPNLRMLGRLGTYSYGDVDDMVSGAIKLYKEIKK
jgi:UDP-galactopyranose mutase